MNDWHHEIRVESGGRSHSGAELTRQKSPIGPQHTIYQRGVLEDSFAKVFRGEVLLEGRERQRVLDRLLGKFDDQRPVFDPSAAEVATRPYIPGILNHGTTPAFIGPKGWGKTTFLCRELAPALIIPGRRFLGHFEPAKMTEAERARDVWLINSETRAGAVHEELIAAGLVFAKRDGVPCYVSPDLGLGAGVLIVEQLPESGGASQFDLTDPVKFEDWEARFLEFTGRHDAPLMVIADGLTAAMRNDTGRTGAQTSAFRLLLQEAGIPNGMGVLHSPMDPRVHTPMGGIESGAEWDGHWYATADKYPIMPSTPRHFFTRPRMGDPEVPRRRIVRSEAGGLRYVDAGEKLDRLSESEGDPRRDRLLGRLQGGASLWTAELCGNGDEFKANKKVLAQLEREGEVIAEQVQEGRTRGYRWRLPATTD